jgi:hypothetical protein
MGKQAGRPMGKRHQDDVRAKIQASQIINRFYDAFEGKVELTSVQVNIGKVLLDKALPDLKAIEHSGDPDNPLNVISKIEHYIVDPKDTNT